MSKFQDDPIVNKIEIVVLLGKVWVYSRKRESFERGRRENEFWRKKEYKNV